MRKRTSPVDDGDDTSAPSGGDRQFITSLYRGLEVLRAFRPDDRAGLSNGDLADRTGLPNSTVSRLTYTLLKTGYLLYDDATGRYRMGVPVLSLGYACLSGMSVRDAAQGYMQELADEVGEGVLLALGGRDAHTMTYLATARTKSVIALQLGVGSRISLARSAMGRAYIAACSQDERAEILEMLEMLEQKTAPEDWPTIKAGIDRSAQEIAERGFCRNISEWQPSVNSVAVPFRSSDPSEPLLVFNLGGPASYLAQDRMEREIGPKLVQLAETLSLGISAKRI